MDRRQLAGLIVTAGWLLAPPAVSAEPLPPARSELLFFVSGEAFRIQGSPAQDTSLDGLLTADVLGSWTEGRFRVMGELVLSSDEVEFERMQLGWELAPETMAWVGRFHQPGSPWNTRNHHGRYLQPSISRPAIEEWEDETGVVPQHVEGLLVESRLELKATRGVLVSVGAGVGPIFTDGELEPFQVFDPRDADRRPAYGLQVIFLPDFSSDDGFGLVASHNEIPLGDRADVGGSDHYDLTIVGAFVDVGHGPWQVTSTVYALSSHLSGGSTGRTQSFVSGYLQLQRRLGSGLTALTRVEASDGADRSDYVALFDKFVDRRVVVGLRWDFAQRQALSLEWADSSTLHEDYREYRLQWSAVLP